MHLRSGLITPFKMVEKRGIRDRGVQVMLRLCMSNVCIHHQEVGLISSVYLYYIQN